MSPRPPAGAEASARAADSVPFPTPASPWTLPVAPWSAVAWTAWDLRGQAAGPVVVVADGPRTLEALYQDLHAMGREASADHLLYFPGWEALLARLDEIRRTVSDAFDAIAFRDNLSFFREVPSGPK